MSYERETKRKLGDQSERQHDPGAEIHTDSAVLSVRRSCCRNRCGHLSELPQQDTYRELDQLAKTVKQNYYTDVDENDVMQGAMKGYVAGLDDPYSQYMTDEEYSAYQTDEAGQTIGIGVTVQQNEDGYLQVVSVSDDSPAKDAGIQADDVILKVGEDDVAELGYAGAVAQVRGEAGTTVTLTIQRGDQTKELEVERRSMDVITAQGKMLDGNIGYIRISAFKGNTPERVPGDF